MSNENQLEKLQAQRNAKKGQLKSFSGFLSDYNKDVDVVELQLRYQRLTANFANFDTICDDINVLDDSETSKNERFAILDEFYKLSSKTQQLMAEAFAEFNIASNQIAQASDSGAASVTHSHDGGHSSSCSMKRKLKLPQASIPSFDGQLENWLSFKNSFVALIDSQDDISNVEKLQYLQSALRSEASQKIKVFSISDENYLKAWDLLKRVYENRRLLIARHLSILLNLPKQDKDNPKSLEVLADKTILNVESLTSLGVNLSLEIVVQILQERLLPSTRLDMLTEFMYQRAALQSMPRSGATATDDGPSSKIRKTDNKNSARSFTTLGKKCIVCSEQQHALYQCKKFRGMSLNEKIKVVKDAGLCSNCLRNHGTAKCKFGGCKICEKPHNTLLHFPKSNKDESKATENSGKSDWLEAKKPSQGLCFTTTSFTFDLMTSALIRVADKGGNLITCKTLLDTCSTTNFITQSLAKRLKLYKTRCSLTIGAMNDLSTTANHFVQVTFKSIHSEFQKTLIFFVVPVIADSVPTETIPRESFDIPKNIKLADPEFHKSSSVDLLIASGPTLSMFCTGQFKLGGSGNLILQKTRLGWIIGGHFNFDRKKKKSQCMITDLSFDLEKFWNVEEIYPVKSTKANDDSRCEEIFKENVTRDENGRYVVALPFKENFELGESRSLAMKRLLSLMKKFKSNKDFEKQYENAMNEYIRAGHMTLIENGNVTTEGYYIPHLAVIKDSSNTTKFRVVFDASVESSNGKALNHGLIAGPIIQDDLFTDLVGFREYVYVLIGDLEKMFKQFWVRPKDRIFLKVLWPLNGEIREWMLNTVTFGLTSAPFLTIRCLHQLAHDEGDRFPLAAKILKNDMYVDNMLTGTNSREEAREIVRQMNGILETACLKMRQWASNDKSILDGIAEQDLDVDFNFDKDNALKTLGMLWKAKTDAFIYVIRKIELDEKVTKRQILSDIAKIFDPLGLLGPIILFAKKIMQDAWQTRTDWDESVTSQIQFYWNKFCNQLNSIETITFARKVVVKSDTGLVYTYGP